MKKQTKRHHNMLQDQVHSGQNSIRQLDEQPLGKELGRVTQANWHEASKREPMFRQIINNMPGRRKRNLSQEREGEEEGEAEKEDLDQSLEPLVVEDEDPKVFQDLHNRLKKEGKTEMGVLDFNKMMNCLNNIEKEKDPDAYEPEICI